MKQHRFTTLSKATILAAMVLTTVLPYSQTLARSADAALQVDLRYRVPLAETPGQFRVV